MVGQQRRGLRYSLPRQSQKSPTRSHNRSRTRSPNIRFSSVNRRGRSPSPQRRLRSSRNTSASRSAESSCRSRSRRSRDINASPIREFRPLGEKRDHCDRSSTQQWQQREAQVYQRQFASRDYWFQNYRNRRHQNHHRQQQQQPHQRQIYSQRRKSCSPGEKIGHRLMGVDSSVVPDRSAARDRSKNRDGSTSRDTSMDRNRSKNHSRTTGEGRVVGRDRFTPREGNDSSSKDKALVVKVQCRSRSADQGQSSFPAGNKNYTTPKPQVSSCARNGSQGLRSPLVKSLEPEHIFQVSPQLPHNQHPNHRTGVSRGWGGFHSPFERGYYRHSLRQHFRCPNAKTESHHQPEENENQNHASQKNSINTSNKFPTRKQHFPTDFRKVFFLFSNSRYLVFISLQTSFLFLQLGTSITLVELVIILFVHHNNHFNR